MLIALSGPAGVGKTTLAKALCREHGFQRIGFADALKAMMGALYAEVGLDVGEIHRRLRGDLKETPDPMLGMRSPRHAMQTLGTEWGRDQMAPDFWIGVWQRSVASAFAANQLRVVVDDCRFENEARAVRDMGGCVVGLVREVRSTIAGSHASEKGVAPDFRFVLWGNHRAADLLAAVEQFWTAGPV